MLREQHSKSDQGDLASDIIWGVNGKNGIAKFLNIPPAKAYYLSRGMRSLFVGMVTKR